MGESIIKIINQIQMAKKGVRDIFLQYWKRCKSKFTVKTRFYLIRYMSGITPGV
jgi:hypothetical protein